MFIDARDLTDGSTLDTDLCVIGAGAAGITIARELADGPLDVILLESGDLESDADTQALYQGEMTGTPFADGFDPSREIPLADVRLRYFGGTTNHWAGYCRPLEPIDFESRPYLPLSGWPITRADLDPWYERAHEVVRLGAYDYDWEYWHDQGLPPTFLDAGPVETKIIQIKFPFSFGEVYEADLRAAGNVRVVLRANVTALTTNPEGTQLTGAEVAVLDGPRFTVNARAYVLATGGIEVPRLLLASDGARPGGIGNEHDLVGRHFTDHLLVPAGFAALHQPIEAAALFVDQEQPAATDGELIAVRAALALTADAVRQHELLGLELQLVPGPLTVDAPRQDEGAATPDVGALVGAVEGADAASVAYVQALAEQQLDPESRVTIDRSDPDPLGVPRVRLDWRVGETDRDSIRRGLALLGAELGSSGIGRLQAMPGALRYNPEPDEAAGPLAVYRVEPEAGDAEFPVAPGFHHMCTTRMASDPTQGVVDADCRVHSVVNLYIGGSATFATPGISTPTLTIVALALRLADHLERELG